MPDEGDPGPVGGQGGGSPSSRATEWSEDLLALPTRAIEWLDDERTCWKVLGSAMLAFGALVLWLGRDTTLFVDEANYFVVDRGFDPEALLTPLNGHLVVVVRIIYAADFELFGPNFLVLRLLHVAGATLAAGLLFILLKRRVGPAAALAPTLLLLFLGSAWEGTFIPSGLTFVYSLAAGFGALLALERADARGDLAACVLLIASVATWSLGVAFAIGATVWILLVRDRRRQWWVVVAPLALYGAWLLWVRTAHVPEHGEIQNLTLSNVLLIPNYIATEAAVVAAAVAGLNYDFQPDNLLAPFGTDYSYGLPIAALAVAGLALRLRRGNVPSFLWASIAILLAFWAALALTFGIGGRTPTTVRYVYPSAAVAFLVAAEAVRGIRLSRTALLAIFAVTAVALSTNLARLREGMEFYREYATSLRAQLTAIELASGRVSPTFVPSSGPTNFLTPVDAGPYLAAVDRIGSAAFSPAELADQPEGKRHEADMVLVSALGIGIAAHARGERARSCRHLAGERGEPLQIVVRPPGVQLRSPIAANVAVHRFATSTTVEVGTLPAGTRVALPIPADSSSRPWHVTVTPATRAVTACELAG